MDTLATTEGQVWVGLFAFLGSVLSTAVMLYTQTRNRRWAKEDAKEVADQLAAKQEAALAEVKQAAIDRHQVLVQKIDDNTSLTAWAADKAAMALTEANNFDRKWMVIEKIFAAAHQEPTPEVRAAILDTQGTVKATHEIVARELDHRGGHDDRG